MKSLYLRIYLTVVAVLLLFAAVSGWVFQRHLEQERVRVEGLVSDRTAAWATCFSVPAGRRGAGR